MKPFSITVTRPAKFGASAADISTASNELAVRIRQRLPNLQMPGLAAVNDDNEATAPASVAGLKRINSTQGHGGIE